MATHDEWMIYGANGYTGRLIAEKAVGAGFRPVLAGRRRAAIQALAAELGLEYRGFSLEAQDEIVHNLRDIRAVSHCAGPFSATAEPMMDACIASKTHYSDITGEIDVIEAGASRDKAAKDAGIALMPAVGFDVVPTDCLAAMLAAEMPDATKLELAFDPGDGKASPGTTKTMVESLPRGGFIRQNGEIESVPTAYDAKEIPFSTGKRMAVSIPWGDVSSAYYSTGIGDIVVYLATPPKQIQWMRRLRPFLRVLSIGFVRRFVMGQVERRVRGPDAAARAASGTALWGKVANAAGETLEATLDTPSGYALTVETALRTVTELAAGNGPVGFATPSMAFGKEFVLSFEGVRYALGERSG